MHCLWTISNVQKHFLHFFSSLPPCNCRLAFLGKNFLLPFDCYSFFLLRASLSTKNEFYLSSFVRCNWGKRKSFLLHRFLSFWRYIILWERKKENSYSVITFMHAALWLLNVCVQSSGIKTGSRLDCESRPKASKNKNIFYYPSQHIKFTLFHLDLIFLTLFISFMEKRLCVERGGCFSAWFGLFRRENELRQWSKFKQQMKLG